MSTNYYHHSKPPCPCCGREYEPRHIGLSAAGWAFLMHVYPGEGIDSYYDWEKLWKQGTIRDEYGRTVTPDEMELIVAGRVSTVRHCPVDGIHCMRRGEGTWDYCIGEYS